HSAEIRDAVQEPIQQIVGAVRRALEITPPELAADIVERGIVMTGGGALIRGLDVLLSQETGLPIHVDEDPLTCVVRGCGRSLDQQRTQVRDSVTVKAMAVVSLENENERLRQLIGLGSRIKWGFIAAEAIHGRGVRDVTTMTLTAGSNSGVRRLSPVIAPEGV